MSSFNQPGGSKPKPGPFRIAADLSFHQHQFMEAVQQHANAVLQDLASAVFPAYKLHRKLSGGAIHPSDVVESLRFPQIWMLSLFQCMLAEDRKTYFDLLTRFTVKPLDLPDHILALLEDWAARSGLLTRWPDPATWRPSFAIKGPESEINHDRSDSLHKLVVREVNRLVHSPFGNKQGFSPDLMEPDEVFGLPMLEIAVATLRSWYAHRRRTPLRWAYPQGFPSVKAEPYNSLLKCPSAKHAEVRFDNRKIRALQRLGLSTDLVKFSTAPWDPTKSSRAAYADEAKSRFAEALARHLDAQQSAAEARLTRTEQTNEDSHYRWLVLYQVGRNSFPDLARTDLAADEPKSAAAQSHDGVDPALANADADEFPPASHQTGAGRSKTSSYTSGDLRNSSMKIRDACKRMAAKVVGEGYVKWLRPGPRGQASAGRTK